MFNLYTWYAWDMGRWVLRKTADTVAELKEFLKAEPGQSYKITDATGKIVDLRINTAGYRQGMVKPDLSEQ